MNSDGNIHEEVLKSSSSFDEIILDKILMFCGADARISASCENGSSANILSLTLKETKLALILCQIQNLLFFTLRRRYICAKCFG